MIAIFGANGFLGRHLVRRLAEGDRPLRAVSRRFEPDFRQSLGDRVDWQEADLRQPLPMTAALQDVETVVQLASDSTPGLANDSIIADIEANVLPHVAFLEACVRRGVRRYVFLSSGGTVYGPGAPVPTPETSATTPISSHGLTKLVVEKYIQMHGIVDGLEHVVLRVSNPFGPGQVFRKGQGLVPALLDRWQRRQPVRIYGDGRARRDYVYVDDVIDAIEAAVALDGAPKLVLNVGSGVARSVLDVAAALEALLERPFEYEYVKARDTDVDTVCLAIARAQEVLGWRPATDFETGLRRTVEAWRAEHPSAQP